MQGKNWSSDKVAADLKIIATHFSGDLLVVENAADVAIQLFFLLIATAAYKRWKKTFTFRYDKLFGQVGKENKA